MVDKKVMDYMKTKVESGFYIKDPSYFSMTCRNICGLTDKEQGAEVEKYLENITGFEIVIPISPTEGDPAKLISSANPSKN